ncbi:DUF3616 domain-containing protein [Kaistia algarum]|uniref:DUF3616 domain-containing protein n=1 Tax=Kaistia algarum TaxID=2083279 RepID=UPI0014026C06|nr:DUF3616 domain-containing protein [Kaistia algarum]MCX5515013.1 DUF3616 domain-containing protein [Kaistia algarum]
MKHFLLIIACLAAMPLVTAIPGPAVAESGPFFNVTGKLLGKTDDGTIQDGEDLSGIACAEEAGFPRHCLLVDDESQFAQSVTIETGSITVGGCIRVTDATYISKKGKTKPAELDGEGVAYFKGAFYVIGSHGHPRDKEKENSENENQAKLKASSIVRRISVEDAGKASGDCRRDQDLTGTPSVNLGPLLSSDPALQPHYGQRLEQNGLTIEGVAIKDNVLYAGLRAPIVEDALAPKDPKLAVVFAVNLDAIFDTKAADARLSKLRLEGRGVRDLVAYSGGFLILAGPSADPDKSDPIGPNDYAVFFWDGDKRLTKLGTIAGNQIGPKDWAKPEALLPLGPKDGKLEVLILFDGAPANRAARADTIDAP